MNKVIYSLRFFASIPFYAISILLWAYVVKTVIESTMLVFLVYLTPYSFGQVLGTWIVCIVMAGISVGIWMLGRYVRTSHFKSAPKPTTAELP